MNTREPGIDLIRCMGLLFVTGVHSFLYNGFYSEPQVGAAMWAANSIRWLFMGCNGVFLLLTGYLKCCKPLNKGYYRSLLPVLMGYLLTCAISFPIRHFALGEKLTLLQWLEKLVTFGNYGWYVEMYIGLILFAPVINLALERLTERRQLLWLAGTMVTLSALPSITPLNLIPDYWSSLYPITYYVLGAVIRRLQPRLKVWQGLLGAAVITCGLGLVTVLSTDSVFSNGFNSQSYGGFWVTLSLLFLFVSLYRVRPGAAVSRCLSWMAGGCFEGYLLSRLFDVWLYDRFTQWHRPEAYLLILLCVTLPILLVSMTAGRAVHTLAIRLTAPRSVPVQR